MVPAPGRTHDRPGGTLIRNPARDLCASSLEVLPVEALFEEWRGTGEPAVLGRGDPGSRFRLRRLLIAELRRRDPVGTERWLSQAPEAPPEDYVRDTHDRAA